MTSKRIYQSIDFTLHHIMASGFSLILLIGAFLGEVFLTKTIWFYLLMYILSVCGLALLITVLWEGFACYTFTEDSITFRNIIRKETILKSEVLFTEPIEVLLIAGDSISHGSAIRIYDHKVKIQIETNEKTIPFLKLFLDKSFSDPPYKSKKHFWNYNRKYIVVLGSGIILLSLIELFIYLFCVI